MALYDEVEVGQSSGFMLLLIYIIPSFVNSETQVRFWVEMIWNDPI